MSIVIAIMAVTSMNVVIPDGFVGVDTYPILLTSQFDSPSALWNVVREKLMPGFHPYFEFYRPVAGVVWGACYGAWGLEAGRYLQLNQLIHMVNTLLLIPMAMLLFGRFAKLIGFAGAALFALYPLSVDNVPVVARMPDLLAATLILVTLLMHGAPVRWRKFSPFVALLAFGVKEVAFLIPALVYFFDICRGRKWKNSAIRALPCAILLALFLVARNTVLGGIGGYTSGGGNMGSAGDTLVSFARTLILPFDPVETYRLGGHLNLLVRLSVGLLAALGWYRFGRGIRDKGEPNRAAIFLLIWIAAVIALHLPARGFERRYVYLASLPSCLLLARLMFASPPRRIVGRMARSAAAFLIVWQVSFTPAFGGYQEWKIGERLAQAFLDGISLKAEALNEDISTMDCPWKISYRPDKVPYIDQAVLLSNRSVRGYLRLRYPGYSGEVSGRPRPVYIDADGNTSF